MAREPNESQEAEIRRLRSLAARIRKSTGWTGQDLHVIYTEAGFVCEEGAKHRRYTYPGYRGLVETVSRSSGELPCGYAQSCRKRLKEIVTLIESESTK